ncbi:MAG: succinylglutamate desuccinylase/aspartoacylase family protein [Pseudomonadota bacterium]
MRAKGTKQAEGRPVFTLGGVRVAPGQWTTVELPISRLSTHTPMALPVRVLHGRQDGPVMFVSASVHGDEIIGVEIIRRLLRTAPMKGIRGTLLCIPVVNVFGFIAHTRYLPDRRDLNRSFPGTANGSLASQLAHVFRSEIVARCSCGIDIHSAALHRNNLPQIRIDAARPKAEALALAFGAPAIISAPLREGSLRKTAAQAGVDVLLYEAGEALRFDEIAVRIGVKGILRVMQHMGMISSKAIMPNRVPPVRSSATYWVRAGQGGIFRILLSNGARVDKGQVLGVISDPLGETEEEVRARVSGIIIGHTNLPVVNQGDALVHIAEVKVLATADQRIGQIQEDIVSDPLFDEDEII